MNWMVWCLGITLILARVDSAKPLGSEKCTWGPSYWCSGLTESAGCRATKHCIDTVWTKTIYPVDTDDVCTICKNMVAQARDQLESNETQTELKEVFEGSCKLIPIKLVATECIKLADEFIPELVETLASEMNPETVCSVAGLCNSRKVDKLLKHFYDQHQLTNCDRCRVESRKLAYNIRSMEQDALLDKALQLCGIMGPSYENACKITILDEFDDIYKGLINMDKGLCDLVGMCGEGISNEADELVGDNVECEFCEKVIKHWVDTWTANVTVEEFKEVLDALCHKITDATKQQRCQHFVDDYYIPWFNFLLHEIDPKVVCSFVGLCATPSRSDLSRQASTLKPIPNNTLIGGYFAPKTAMELNQPGCVICEYVLFNLHQMIQPEKSRPVVEKALEEVCNLVPKSVADQCHQVVETYGKAIIEFILMDFEPDKVCKMLRLCPAAGLVVSQPPLPPAILAIKTKENECVMCQYGLQYVFEILENKDDRDEIRNALQTMCRVLPKSVEQNCEDFVYKYTEQVVDLIVKNFTPDQICSAMALCPNEPVEQGTKEACILCEYVIQTVDDMLKNESDREVVKQALEKACSYLPKSISEECVTMVNTYSDMIIQFLSQGLSPEKVCTELHLCDPSPTSDPPAPVLAIDLNDEKPYCLLCEYVFTELEKIIEDKQNEQEIKNALDQICYKLSTPIAKECVNMVNSYTDAIIEMIVKEYTPKDVCQKLTLCKPSNDSSSTTESPSEIQTNVKEDDSASCVLCEFAMSILEKHLLTNSTMDAMERAVQMICSYMPATISDSCIQFVDKYGDMVIHLIVEAEMNPKEVCSALTLCVTSDLWDAKPLGGTYCAFGPALWCQSMVHAQTCGLLEYCQSYIWN